MCNEKLYSWSINIYIYREREREREIHWVIWLNIVKFGFYLHYRHCSNLFREMRKESEFRQRWLPKFLLPKPAARSQKGNQLWQCHCRNRGRKKKLWQCHCRKWEGKKNSSCQNLGMNLKKKCYIHNIFIIFLQQITDD